MVWRRVRDSNPRAISLATRFRVELVMTTSITLRVIFQPNFSNLNLGKWREKLERKLFDIFDCTAKTPINQGFSRMGFQSDHWFSSQSRYDHFDTTPYMLNSRRSVTDYLIFSVNGTSPVMSCCGIPKKSSHPLALDFIRPRPLLFARFFCHRQRSQTSPLRYHTVLTKLRIIAITSTAILL